MSYLLRTTWVLLILLLWAPRAQSQEMEVWEDDPFEFAARLKQEKLDAARPEIGEPFFAMILQYAAGDSLGQWYQPEVAAFINQRGEPSRFPVDKLVSLSRRRPTPDDSAAWPGVAIQAVWSIHLTGSLEPAMPYSILGYHPGTLRVSGDLRLLEAHLGGISLRVEGTTVMVTQVHLFRLEKGTVALDVDGWLDSLLGKALDDAAVVGFVTAREQDRLLGLGVSLGRKGRKIYGEFDFRRDKVLPNGRPLASALSAACRSLLNRGRPDPLARAWGR